MTRIEFFTMPGCQNCVTTKSLLDRLSGEYADLQIEEIDLADKPWEAARYQIMACPALAIDGKLAFLGGTDERELRRQLDPGRVKEVRRNLFRRHK